jgi:hypothetical protein
MAFATSWSKLTSGAQDVYRFPPELVTIAVAGCRRDPLCPFTGSA